MQARSRWLMFFLAVIALLVVAIWPRSEPTESHSPNPTANAPGRIPRRRRSSRPELHICGPQQRRFPALRPRRHRP